MKLNIASPNNGTQKSYEIEDEKTLAGLNDRRLGQEFDAGFLGEQFKGYILRITGGQDKQGFPMKQGVMASARVKLLLTPGTVGFQAWRAKKGERRRKSIRGCIIATDIALLNLIIISKGQAELDGLTDVQVPRRLGPKRASKIRKLFDLGKEDDVRKFVIKRQVVKEGKKPTLKAPKIQRLVTPVTVHRRRKQVKLIKARREKSTAERKAYQALIDRRKQRAAQGKRTRAFNQKKAAAKKATA